MIEELQNWFTPFLEDWEELSEDTVILSLEDIENARERARMQPLPEAQWQSYINELGLKGFLTWIADRDPQIAIGSSENELLNSQLILGNLIGNLKIGSSTVCLLAVENSFHTLEVQTAILKDSRLIADFYSIVEILEEEGQICIRGFLTRAQLTTIAQSDLVASQHLFNISWEKVNTNLQDLLLSLRVLKRSPVSQEIPVEQGSGVQPEITQDEVNSSQILAICNPINTHLLQTYPPIQSTDFKDLETDLKEDCHHPIEFRPTNRLSKPRLSSQWGAKIGVAATVLMALGGVGSLFWYPWLSVSHTNDKVWMSGVKLQSSEVFHTIDAQSFNSFFHSIEILPNGKNSELTSRSVPHDQPQTIKFPLNQVSSSFDPSSMLDYVAFILIDSSGKVMVSSGEVRVWGTVFQNTAAPDNIMAGPSMDFSGEADTANTILARPFMMSFDFNGSRILNDRINTSSINYGHIRVLSNGNIVTSSDASPMLDHVASILIDSPGNARTSSGEIGVVTTASEVSRIIGRPESGVLLGLTGSDKTSDQTQRVEFPHGRNNMTVTGSIASNEIRRYSLKAKQGQLMSVKVVHGKVTLSAISPNGQQIGGTTSTLKDWKGRLLQDGDYAIEVSTTQPDDYAISFEIF